MEHAELSDAVYRQLCSNIEGEVAADYVTRALYSTDSSIYQIFPLAVIYPRTEDDLAAAISIANDSYTPIIVRGAGSGLAGETLGRAIIVDCSRWLTGIQGVDTASELVRVQPGVVLERLNAHLAPMNKRFGPDPGSASRATMGGIVANNAAGMHSLVHGVTRDNLESLDLILSDGSRMTVGPDAERPPQGTLGAKIWDEMLALLQEHAELIEEKTPRQLKRHRAGYLLHDVLLNAAGDSRTMDLSRLICGSEGTLAAVASATLRICDPLRATGVALFPFRRVDHAADAVPLMLRHDPASVEMLDDTILTMARDAGRVPSDLAPADARSTLMVEIEDESEAAVQDRLEKLERDVRANTAVMDRITVAADADERRRIWAVRSSGEPLLHGRPGRRHPITLVEDIAVSPDRLGDYVRELDRIWGERDVEYAAYGHSGVGLLHTRPYIDLRDPKDLETAQVCADATYSTAIAMGGSVSGEHGDGITRTPYLPDQYGDLYPVFGRVKEAFDPRGVLNPDKIWPSRPRESLLQNLKMHPGQKYRARKTMLVWREGEFENELDKCNSCGECRVQNRANVMCPLHKDSRDERSAPRGKVNLMRALMNGALDETFFEGPEVKKIMDYCVNCKGCHLECPLQVNVPKLMTEAKAQYVKRQGQSLPNALMARSEAMSKAGARAAPASNLIARFGPAKKAMEIATGVDARRDMPEFRYTSLEELRKACPHPEQPTAKVALFLDLYARYNDPDLAFAFLDVLRANDVEAVIPDQESSGLPAISYASIGIARKKMLANARAFAPYIEQGYRVVAIEPSAALALREESLDLSDEPEVRRLSESATDAMSFLNDLRKERKLKTDHLERVDLRVGYHTPCHVKALGSKQATLDLIRLVPGVEVDPIDEGCCGIAGTWGMKRDNYEQSMRIGKQLFEALGAESIEAGLSECSTCRMQMEHGSGKPAVHPIKILAQAYQGAKKPT